MNLLPVEATAVLYLVAAVCFILALKGLGSPVTARRGNLIALITHDGNIAPDFDDEVVAGACLTRDGEVRHEPTADALKGAK